MQGMSEFLDVFGHITILNLVEFGVAVWFGWRIYKRFSAYLVERAQSHNERDRELQEVLEAVRKYPEYRQQSIKIQRELTENINELREKQMENIQKIAALEETLRRRELSKLRDRLLQSYRYYTSTTKNPKQQWTSMEAEAFWEVFREYEMAGGNGHMHTVVQPAMTLLGVVDIEDEEAVSILMATRA